jgi:hypothetical protein
MTIYKIKIALYNKRINTYKNSSAIVDEIERNMLKRKCVQNKITYSKENAYIEKIMRQLLYRSITMGVRNILKSGMLMSEAIFEVFF